MLLNSQGPRGRLRAPSQALATLIGAPPLWDVGFLPTHMPTSLWVDSPGCWATEFSPYGFSHSLRVRQSFCVTNNSSLPLEKQNLNKKYWNQVLESPHSYRWTAHKP